MRAPSKTLWKGHNSDKQSSVCRQEMNNKILYELHAYFPKFSQPGKCKLLNASRKMHIFQVKYYFLKMLIILVTSPGKNIIIQDYLPLKI